MFTICPKCSLKLVVTAADLRVAQGYVRCGRCSNVFNALIGLSDEQQAVLAREDGATESDAAAQAADAEPETSAEERATPQGETPSDAALEFDPSQTDISEVFIEAELDESGETGSFESIVLSSEEEPAESTPGAIEPSERGEAAAEPSRSAKALQTGSALAGDRPTGGGTRTPGELLAQAGPRVSQAAAPSAQVPPRPAEGGARPAQTDRRAAQADARLSSDDPRLAGRPRRDEPPGQVERTASQAPGAAPSRGTQQAKIMSAQRGAGAGADAAAARGPSAPTNANAGPSATGTANATARSSARTASPATAAATATGRAPAAGAQTASAVPKASTPGDVQEFEFDPVVSAARGATRDGTVVQLARGSNSERAAIVREAARRFIQTSRAPQAPPATRAAAAPAIAGRNDRNPPDGPEIIDSVGAARMGAAAASADGAAAPALPERAVLAAVVVLGVILLAQILNHYRSDLADLDWLRPPLTALYSRLGTPLVPRWDVGAYEVHQLGAVAGEAQPGALTVRASIKNTASKAQPLPLLRVTVQDRFGNRVAARDVPPRAYLPTAGSAPRDLAAGQRVDAEVELVDPGPSAVGFEIDACLADAAGRVSCANDASEAAASPSR
jgi:predicted Zn finger-like uncharacterized protein